MPAKISGSWFPYPARSDTTQSFSFRTASWDGFKFQTVTRPVFCVSKSLFWREKFTWIGNGLQISYVSQDTAHLRGSLEDYAKSHGIDASLFLAMLAKLDVPKQQMEKDMASLSAGQKKKVLLAKSICQPAHLHIWDEPMNYIDVISRMQIEQLLLNFAPTILFVEHDRTFCEHIATKIVEL